MSEQNPHITVRVESDDKYVPLEAFLVAVKGMKELVAEVDNTLNVDEAVKQWNVTGLELGSAVLTISPKSENTADAIQRVRTIYEGIASIQRGNKERPSGFSDAALGMVKNMAAVSAKHNGNVRVIVGDALDKVQVGKETTEQIKDWLSAKRASVGSIEGTLESVTIHGVRKFTIYEKSGRKVSCTFPPDMMLQVKQALGERICVRGKVNYREDGVPVSIQPQIIKVLSSNSELPQIEDLIGIWDLGMTGDEYIRGLRDA